MEEKEKKKDKLKAEKLNFNDFLISFYILFFFFIKCFNFYTNPFFFQFLSVVVSDIKKIYLKSI